MSQKPDVAMTRDEIDALLGSGDIAFVAYRNAEGRLSAAPFRYAGNRHAITLYGAAEAASGQRAIAIVDQYPAYDKIKGALLRGVLAPEGKAARLQIDHAAGFDFAKVGQ